MQIHENFPLKPYNTFGIDAKARYFSTFSNTDELSELTTHDSQLTTLVLGGGSNILFTKDYDGTVLKNNIRGIDLQHEDEEHVYVKVGAGENWHQFVLHCIDHNWAGIENLSLIPGNVGASPIQNIGAYGVELDDVFWSLEAFHLFERRIHTFTREDCEFGYRNSVFKERYKDQFAIISVTFQLKKKPIFHTDYGAIAEELEKMRVKDLSIQAVSQAIINIRSSKLPDPQKIANAGSFFKNPMISSDHFESIKSSYPDLPGYPDPEGLTKVPAGWLIEKAGWKGKRFGDAGSYEKQSQVLVNYGKATGTEIWDLAQQIIASVHEQFNVELSPEVNLWK